MNATEPLFTAASVHGPLAHDVIADELDNLRRHLRNRRGYYDTPTIEVAVYADRIEWAIDDADIPLHDEWAAHWHEGAWRVHDEGAFDALVARLRRWHG